uniref:Nuclear transcription factor Y subunit beta n=1 Tax=Zeugodacus cucurbitae TaxID=28588 RepID=A0A0A1WQK4_ZEUCU
MSTSGDSQPYLTDFMMRDDEDGVSGDDESDNKHSGGNYMLREQDRFLPICNIIKIMKVPVPENGKIAKDARECIQECVSEFISFITSEAIERSIAENRKTVNGDDLLYAFANLGFDNYVEPLSMYLHKFRESTKSDRNLYNETNMLQDDSSTEFRKTDMS